MGAINYSQINAKHVYAIEGEIFDEDYTPVSYLTENFPRNDEWKKGCTGWIPNAWKYGQLVVADIASKFVYIESLDIEISINIYAVAGYYDGATIDYDIITRNLFVDRALSEYNRNNAELDMASDIANDKELSSEDAAMIGRILENLTTEAEKICMELATDIFEKPGWVMKRIA
mgnify:CR=1 FL=1